MRFGWAILLLGLVATSTVSADPTLSLSSSPADLSNLAVGQTITVDVVLSNIADSPTGDLEFLAADLGWDAALLGNPTSISDGPIVPDTSGVSEGGGPGLVSCFYDALLSLSGGPIISDGVFFSFELMAQDLGSGVIEITFAEGADTTGFPVDVIPGPDLRLNVVPEPEPPACLTWAIMLGLLGIAVRVGRSRLLR